MSARLRQWSQVTHDQDNDGKFPDQSPVEVRYPRWTELARRFQATTAEIDAAVDELVRHGPVLRLASGQVHRARPTEYLVTLDGPAELSSVIGPLNRA